jgi:hypothetical protein
VFSSINCSLCPSYLRYVRLSASRTRAVRVRDAKPSCGDETLRGCVDSNLPPACRGRRALRGGGLSPTPTGSRRGLATTGARRADQPPVVRDAGENVVGSACTDRDRVSHRYAGSP